MDGFQGQSSLAWLHGGTPQWRILWPLCSACPTENLWYLLSCRGKACAHPLIIEFVHYMLFNLTADALQQKSYSMDLFYPRLSGLPPKI